MKYLKVCTKKEIKVAGVKKTIFFKVGYIREMKNGKRYLTLFTQPETDFYIFEQEDERFTSHDVKLFEEELQNAGDIDQLLLDKHAVKFVDGNRVIITNDQPEKYKEIFLKGYQLPGITNGALRVPYSLWMELYHYCQKL